jgi:ATP-binding cassette subfamily B (MDR/TAP) protein 1
MDPEKEIAVDFSKKEGVPVEPDPAIDQSSLSPADHSVNMEDPNEQQVDYSSKAQNATTFKHYLRIFTYSTPKDRILLCIAFFGQIATGTTLPLMNIVFGHLVGNFAGAGNVTKDQFLDNLRTQTLYIVYLFIARWVLNYVSSFIFRMAGLKMSARLRLAYLKALFSLPISVLDTLPAGQASNTITNTANVLQIGISDKLGVFVQFTTLSIAAIIVGFL